MLAKRFFYVCAGPLCLAVGAILPAVAGAQAPPYLTQWGTFGTGPGQFETPVGVTVDNAGNVYVVETDGNRIQKFTSSGGYITQWGSYGSGNGNFNWASGLAVDASANVYVADTQNSRIQKFTSNGGYITQWGSLGAGNGQLYNPTSVAVDASSNVYVADFYNNRVQVFTSNGTYLSQFPTSGVRPVDRHPDGVAVDAAGNIYVTLSSTAPGFIQKFTSSGALLLQWGTLGTGDGQFSAATRAAVDAADNVYVVDWGNCRIQVFTGGGVYLTQWGTVGTGPGQFLNPIGVAVNRNGDVYVADTNNERIQVFGPVPTPTVTQSWGGVKARYRPNAPATPQDK